MACGAVHGFVYAGGPDLRDIYSRRCRVPSAWPGLTCSQGKLIKGVWFSCLPLVLPCKQLERSQIRDSCAPNQLWRDLSGGGDSRIGDNDSQIGGDEVESGGGGGGRIDGGRDNPAEVALESAAASASTERARALPAQESQIGSPASARKPGKLHGQPGEASAYQTPWLAQRGEASGRQEFQAAPSFLVLSEAKWFFCPKQTSGISID